MSGSSVSVFTMKTCIPSPAWEGGPFADAMAKARALTLQFSEVV
jgi:hypothetical protein